MVKWWIPPAIVYMWFLVFLCFLLDTAIVALAFLIGLVERLVARNLYRVLMALSAHAAYFAAWCDHSAVPEAAEMLERAQAPPPWEQDDDA